MEKDRGKINEAIQEWRIWVGKQMEGCLKIQYIVNAYSLFSFYFLTTFVVHKLIYSVLYNLKWINLEILNICDKEHTIWQLTSILVVISLTGPNCWLMSNCWMFPSSLAIISRRNLYSGGLLASLACLGSKYICEIMKYHIMYSYVVSILCNSLALKSSTNSTRYIKKVGIGQIHLLLGSYNLAYWVGCLRMVWTKFKLTQHVLR